MVGEDKEVTWGAGNAEQYQHQMTGTIKRTASADALGRTTFALCLQNRMRKNYMNLHVRSACIQLVSAQLDRQPLLN